MLGLEYILNLYNMQHIELAEKLGIKKQNVNMWVKGKQSIPTKHLPKLSEIFGLDERYFSKELDEIDRLEIQKKKLKREIEPVIERYESQYRFDNSNSMSEVPIYDAEEINRLEMDIEKAKLIERFKNALEDSPFIENYRLTVELLEKSQHEVLLRKTLEALAHYFEILPGEIVSDPEQDGFEKEIFEVLDDNNF